VRRRAILLVAAAIVFAVLLPHWLSSGGGSKTTTTPAQPSSPPRARAQQPRRVPTARPLVERSLGTLPAAVQDAAAASAGGSRSLLLGGLNAADVSTSEVLAVGRTGTRALGTLPTALHDAAAVRLGRRVYLFGGGDGVRQLDTIVGIDPASGRAAAAGILPAPSSDQAAAAVGGTAYVVGGYTGSRWLDTIVAWRPGTRARVVGRLPSPLRYAAVTAAGGRVVIAGGSLPDGSASDAVLSFDPASGRVRRLGRLPSPTTHAAAATLGGIAYVIGGRGAIVDTPTARIVSVDLRTRRVRAAGHLSSPRSDLAAIGLGSRILLAGGRGPAGAEDTLAELAPASTTRGRSRSILNLYAADGAGMLTGAARFARPLVYVPNSLSNTVDVIDPRTYRVVEHFDVGALPQHVVPAWNLKTLYVTDDLGNTLTPIDPRTGRPGKPIDVADPYNMYFTPDGRYAIVVAERLGRLDFRDPTTFALRRSVAVPCRGVDHMDFSADGSYLIASCEFSGQLVKVDVRRLRVDGVLDLPDGSAGMPQDVKVSPDGRVFYVADMHANGVWKVDGRRLEVIGFLHTGTGTHGLYPSRNARDLYVTNRGEGSISVISFRTGRQVAKWWIPGGGSPDMGGVSADGRVLWVSGRYDAVVYAISTRDGKLLAKIPVGQGPHGLCVWPQPGRHSLGHTGVLR
jgi:YVTN family beta-propeller protein